MREKVIKQRFKCLIFQRYTPKPANNILLLLKSIVNSSPLQQLTIGSLFRIQPLLPFSPLLTRFPQRLFTNHFLVWFRIYDSEPISFLSSLFLIISIISGAWYNYTALKPIYTLQSPCPLKSSSKLEVSRWR